MITNLTERPLSFLHFDVETSPRTIYEAVMRINPSHLILRNRKGEGFTFHLIRLDQISPDAFESADHAKEFLCADETNQVPHFDLEDVRLERPDSYLVTGGPHVLGIVDGEQGSARGTHGTTVHPAHHPTADAVNTRFVRASLPAQLAVQQIFSLIIYVAKFESDAPGSDLPIVAPPGTSLDFVVEARAGVEVVGPHMLTLQLGDEDESLPLQFKLRATAEGAVHLRVHVFAQGQSLGYLRVQTEAIASGAAEHFTAMRDDARLTLPPSSAPDLTLLIFEKTQLDRTSLTFCITSPAQQPGLGGKTYGPIELRRNPRKFFDQFFAALDAHEEDKIRSPEFITTSIERSATHLFTQLFPRAVQEYLWSLPKEVKSVLIVSEEPWIPWELCRLVGKDASGRFVDGPYLCERFAVSRWFPGPPPPTRLSLQRVGLIVPSDSKLKKTLQEKTYMKKLAAAEPHVGQVDEIPARLVEIISALSRGEHSCWHFAGHGDFTDGAGAEAVVILEQQEYLRPEFLCGAVSNLGISQPLVFWNACCTGRTNYSLTQVGGWAGAFTQAGAAAFIGGLYSVKDEVADLFAQHFYTNLLAGNTLAESVRLARLSVRAAGDPSWLAFTVYGHPAASLEVSASRL